MKVGSGFTYSLGNVLYVPLTSRCNSLTLPQTRGPNFCLPPSVVASLCRVRDAEEGTERWRHRHMWPETQETPQKLPEPMDPISSLHEQVERRPTVKELLQEIPDDTGARPIVIAGEGEPTLRLTALESFVQELRDLGINSSVRVTTNGLLPMDDVAQRLKDCGVDAVSVALMTNDPKQYNRLMKPLTDEGHKKVLTFIQKALQIGLDVEVTAVEQPGVNSHKTDELAKSIGVENPVRWRPFFP